MERQLVTRVIRNIHPKREEPQFEFSLSDTFPQKPCRSWVDFLLVDLAFDGTFIMHNHPTPVNYISPHLPIQLQLGPFV